MSEASPPLVYACEHWEIDLARRELRSGGAPVPLGARAFEIVEILAQSAGMLVTKDELMQRVWPNALVGEGTLHVHISAVRRALGGQGRRFLETAQGRGYRLVGSWAANADAVTAGSSMTQSRSPAPARPSNDVPLPVARLIGRADAERRVKDLLSAYRVVTLTGPGGIGKTALALQSVHGLLADFEQGAFLVELVALADAELLPSTVASVLDLKLGGGRVTADSLARAIGDRHVLLLLDNCEHLIDAVAALVEAVVRLCPRATVLATSREVMRIEGESVYRVPALDVPDPGQLAPDVILGQSAVELFLARAAALDANFALRTDDLAAIAEICRRLDGMPLAIEFAAARAAFLGTRAVAVGLRDRFALLTSGRRGVMKQHQTLRAALDWSYDLLPETEQRLLRYLAVFPAGFTVDAAAAVAADILADLPDVTEGIANLVAKSLVVLDKTETASRWYLLETIRAYTLEKLAKAKELDPASRRHAAYFRDLFAPSEGLSDTRLSDGDWTRRVREIDNVRAALDWSFSPSGDSALGIALTAAFAPVWLHLSLMGECRERCERALQAIERAPMPDARLRLTLQINLGVSLFDMMGPAQQARELLTEALSVAQSLGDLDAQARVLSNLVGNYIFQAEQGKGRAAAEQLAHVAARMGDPAIIRMSDRLMGTALVMLGRPREGQLCLERFLDARPALDHVRLVGYPQDHPAAARAFLARALWLQGFVESAYREALLSLDELQPTDHRLLVCRVLYFGMCRVAPSTGNFDAAEHSIARLSEAAATLNTPFWQTAGRFLAGKLLIERRAFAEGVAALSDAFETCRTTGWRMSYPEFKGALATGLAALGQLHEALDAANDGLAGASQGEDGRDLYIADVLRVKGEVLLQRNEMVAAEAAFLEALATAREQEAMLWELRAALGFARLRRAQSRHDEAREILAPVYDRFTEGHAAPDLTAAKAFLDGLEP